MISCPECRRENPDDANVCIYCGTDLSEAEEVLEWEIVGEVKEETSEEKPDWILRIAVVFLVILVALFVILLNLHLS